MVPPGPKVAFTGGYECNDHQAIWAALDRVRAEHPGVVLLHEGSPKGAGRIVTCWADSRWVSQVTFKPDFTRHKNAAPFKRNDQLLDVLPIGVVVFPRSGISDNLAVKARKLGTPLLDYRKGGGEEAPSGLPPARKSAKAAPHGIASAAPRVARGAPRLTPLRQDTKS